MKRLVGIGVAFALATVLTSCNKAPLSVERTDNIEINLELLFEKDGCKVYRFDAGVRTVYYANCHQSATVSYTESCGKSCSRPVMNVTTKNE